MEQSDQDRIVAGKGVGVSDAAAVQPPPYLKLIADSWEHIFDYLPFADILTMGRTCKRMNQMAGYYMREYFPQFRFELDGEIIVGDYICLERDFYPFISRLDVQWYNESSIKEFLSNVNSFDALKTINFQFGTLTETQIDQMQNALKNIEHISVNRCEISGNIFEQFAKYCSKLKQIHVVSEFNDTLFFSQHYPALECCRYWTPNDTPIAELKAFLEKHSKLNELHVDCDFLWVNRDAFMQSTIQLEVLSVHFLSSFDAPFDGLADILKKFYDSNIYKTLHLRLLDGDTERAPISQALPALPQLKKLSVWENSILDLSQFTNITELEVYKFYADIEMLAKGLPNLEHLSMWRTDVQTILPFIRHSKNLKTIKNVALDEGYLDLVALNNERKKLQNACQISIYVNEDEYLHPKWTSHNFSLELDLVKISRLDTFDTVANSLL